MPRRAAESPFVKIASVMAVITALGVAIVPPLAFYLAGHFATRGAVASEANYIAREISKLIAQNPELWTFEGHRMEGILSLNSDPSTRSKVQVTTKSGEAVAQFPAADLKFLWPSVTEKRPLLDFGRDVGTLTITRCLEKHTKTSLLIGVLSTLMAALVYWALRVVPVRLLKTAWNKLSHMATHDDLTGLPNRALFLEQLDKAVLSLSGSEQRVIVYSVDFDRFKDVNDTMGHAAGDALLKLAAARMERCLRSQDVIARLGGDEFAIFQVGNVDPIQASKNAACLISKMNEPFFLNGREALIGASVGIAVAVADSVADADLLLRQADLALYKSKRGGRGVYHFFEDDMDAELTARKAMEIDLRRALRDREFEIYYQPQIDFKTHRISGVEALLRWHHEARGYVPPAEIIPVIENSGMMWELTEWILREACRETKNWGDVVVAVNLSPSLFQQDGLVEMVTTILEETGFPAHRLELELTEEVLVSDAARTLEALTALRAKGVQVALDDFGTGYSSLGYLRKFPFSCIKIDRSFVHDLEHSESVRTIVGAIIQMGQALHMHVLAEGVETMAQAELLKRAGCHEGQGFLFALPMPGGDALRFISENRTIELGPKMLTAGATGPHARGTGNA